MDSRSDGPRQMAAVACDHLSKNFGSLPALRSLTLEVPRGTLLGLLGPNGAGKTTLIRILLGLIRASGGRARVLGRVVPSADVLPRIGYMPQSLASYTDLKVRQNLELFGRLLAVPAAELGEHTDRALALVHLEARKESRVSELSGGMQRRVSLACALLADPELLLLDEPTVGVDPELRAEFWEYFRRLSRAGRTVIMTTHYMEEATNCDRVVLLHQGEVIADDRPSSIKAAAGAGSLDDAFLALVRREAAGRRAHRGDLADVPSGGRS